MDVVESGTQKPLWANCTIKNSRRNPPCDSPNSSAAPLCLSNALRALTRGPPLLGPARGGFERVNIEFGAGNMGGEICRTPSPDRARRRMGTGQPQLRCGVANQRGLTVRNVHGPHGSHGLPASKGDKPYPSRKIMV